MCVQPMSMNASNLVSQMVGIIALTFFDPFFLGGGGGRFRIVVSLLWFSID